MAAQLPLDDPDRPAPRRDLAELIDPGWARALQPVSATIARLGEFLRAEQAAGRRFLPAGDRILAAFQHPFEGVRVLLVGQDPYPTPGHPIGLCFSVAPDVRPLPKSLQNIFTEYGNDLGHPPPSNGDLSPWARQGVMLLNRALTVQVGKPASHRGKGWEEVTEHAIRALVARDAPLVAILWGSDARKLKPLLGATPVIESVHPSPLSARNGFFGHRPFSRANQVLVEQDADPIDWRLP